MVKPSSRDNEGTYLDSSCQSSAQVLSKFGPNVLSAIRALCILPRPEGLLAYSAAYVAHFLSNSPPFTPLPSPHIPISPRPTRPHPYLTPPPHPPTFPHHFPQAGSDG